MSARRPPAFALWLLDRLGYTSANAPLAGDLLEEYGSGRSTAWFWRQTLLVIVTGARHNAASQQAYMLAFFAGVVVQLPVVFALRAMHLPGQVHGVGRWVAACFLVLMGFAAMGRVKLSLAGQGWSDLQLLCTERGPSQRMSTILAAVLVESFGNYVLMYCIWSLIQRFSAAELAVVEVLWVCWDATWTVVRVPGSRATAAAKPAAEPVAEPLVYQVPELAVRVALRDGAEVFLRPENLVESVFASGDTELAAALFGGRASLEAVRRAVWLGSARMYLAKNIDPALPVAITVQQLEGLVRDARGIRHVERALFVEPRSFWKRLRRRAA